MPFIAVIKFPYAVVNLQTRSSTNIMLLVKHEVGLSRNTLKPSMVVNLINFRRWLILSILRQSKFYLASTCFLTQLLRCFQYFLRITHLFLQLLCQNGITHVENVWRHVQRVVKVFPLLIISVPQPCFIWFDNSWKPKIVPFFDRAWSY